LLYPSVSFCTWCCTSCLSYSTEQSAVIHTYPIIQDAVSQTYPIILYRVLCHITII
jgi:hypothetical protein